MIDLIEQMIDECAKVAERVRDHAASRIHDDGTVLDYRQKIRKETAAEIAKVIRLLRPPTTPPQ